MSLYSVHAFTLVLVSVKPWWSQVLSPGGFWASEHKDIHRRWSVNPESGCLCSSPFSFVFHELGQVSGSQFTVDKISVMRRLPSQRWC